jgi:opacity protein-like surface antigen
MRCSPFPARLPGLLLAASLLLGSVFAVPAVPAAHAQHDDHHDDHHDSEHHEDHDHEDHNDRDEGIPVAFSVDYLPDSFEYEDDTGNRKVTQFTDADFELFAASLEAERTFFQFGRFAPYASVGFSGGWWHLDESSNPTFENSITAGDSETVFRWGGTSGLGARVAITPSFSLNLEANALSIGNPFHGSDAFRVGAPTTTFDEPSSVRVLRVRGGLRYTFY